MAGALTISTLNNDTGVLATQNGMTGIAKAWVQYNSVTQTISSSFNISSVTYNGTGDFTLNFTTAMPNANYAFVCGTTQTGGGGPVLVAVSGVAPTTTQLRLGMGDVGGLKNVAYNCVTIFSS
jgi:hypothetical protein